MELIKLEGPVNSERSLVRLEGFSSLDMTKTAIVLKKNIDNHKDIVFYSVRRTSEGPMDQYVHKNDYDNLKEVQWP
jgi:hypothetical protein